MECYARLFGRAQIGTANGWLELRHDKTSAVLLFLAYQSKWVSRDDLLYLFWPESDDLSGRRNLRQLLSRVRTLGYSDQLEAETNRLRWLVSTDVEEFRCAATQGRWPDMVRLYRGPLMNDFRPRKLSEFDDWLQIERQELHEQWRQAALELADELEHDGRNEEAVDLLGRLHKSDPLDESILRRYMLCLDFTGHKGRALDSYERFRLALEQDMGVEPEQATKELANEVHGGSRGVVSSVTDRNGRTRTRSGALPAQTTRFIGRGSEKAYLTSLLNDATCRMVTIVGGGGTGKTRLAVEVAKEMLPHFEGGVCFVPLAAVSRHDLLATAIAAALDFPFYGPDDPDRQIIRWLRNKELLLVLDNLEQLLPNLELLTQVLEAAPQVRLLTTSRERLRLQGEWVYELEGLTFPEEGETLSAHQHEAVQLFYEAARRSNSAISISESTSLAAARICRKVEGMPLAIELAASWLNVLAVDEVALEVEKSNELLQLPRLNAPPRHQSIRDLFDHSWRLLPSSEQKVLRALTIFRGGFTRAAAKEVTGATLRQLAALVDKSLLEFSAAGRYSLHPLLHEYLEVLLSAHHDELSSLADRHADYYLDELLAEWEARERDPKRHPELPAIESELQNLHKAWLTAAASAKTTRIHACARAFGAYFSHRGSCSEGVRFMQRASESLDHNDPNNHAALASLFAEQSNLLLRVDDYAESRRLAEESLRLCGVGSPSPAPGVALQTLGWINLYTPGHEDEAKRNFSSMLDHNVQREYRQGIGMAIARLGMLEMRVGNLQEAKKLREEAHQILLRVGDSIGITDSFRGMGELQIRLGNLQEARKLLSKGLSLARRSGNQQEEQRIHEHLGTVAHRLGEYEEAERAFAAALKIREEHGLYDSQTSERLKDHASALVGLGEIESARDSLLRALELGRFGFRGLPAEIWEEERLNIVYGFAELRAGSNETESAVELAGLVTSHPSTSPEVRKGAELLLHDLRSRLDEASYSIACKRGERSDLISVTEKLWEYGQIEP